MDIKKTLDCAGLFCPMPVIKTKFELEEMRSGEILEIISDDPGFEKDLTVWCEMTGEKLIGIRKEGNILKGYVQKK